VSRVAFLILAHEQPSLLARLLRHLAGPESPCFVHVDAKVARAPFDEAITGLSHVDVLSDRATVRWAGFGMVDATLRLLTTARAAGPFDRYCLLSGSDLALRSRAATLEHLLATDREWMRIRCRLLGAVPRREDRRIQQRHWMDVRLLNSRERPTGVADRAARAILRRAVTTMNRLLPPRDYVSGLVPYKGSQWWCLTDGCAAHVLSFVASRPDVVAFHRTVFAPDEIFFHSIVKASPFAAHLSHDVDADAEPHVAALHWVRWDGMTARTLDVADWEAARTTSALFARKLDAAKSRALLGRLDAAALEGAGRSAHSAGRA